MMVDAPRRSYDRLRMDPYWDYQDHTGSPLAHGHSFFFSAPSSPQAWQALVPNDNLDLSSPPNSTFELQDGNGRDERDHDEEFEFEFVSPVSESEEPPFSPTLIFTPSSRMLLRPPPPPLLKPPPHLRKPNPLSAQEASPASEKSDALEEDEATAAVQKQEKPSIKVKKWRLKDFLSQSKGQKQKRPPIPHSWPRGRQQGHSMSSCSSSSVVPGMKAINGTAMRMKASSPPAFPLPPPPPTPMSSMPSSTRRSTTTASPHEALYRSKRAQLRDRQKKTSLPYRPGFLGCLGFASKCYIPITEFSRGLQPVT